MKKDIVYSEKGTTFAAVIQNIINHDKSRTGKTIAAQTGIEAVTVATVVEQMMEEIRQSMIGGENVYLRGFGSFILKHRAQKVARNIAKNTSITIPAHNIPAFKPSKEFMDKVK